MGQLEGVERQPPVAQPALLAQAFEGPGEVWRVAVTGQQDGATVVFGQQHDARSVGRRGVAGHGVAPAGRPGIAAPEQVGGAVDTGGGRLVGAAEHVEPALAELVEAWEGGAEHGEPEPAAQRDER
ncbi:MAG: hypothetical protein E6Q80_04395 [Thauera aminoaromatica]|uniref:Uncharacterized protein n=1 Tax=Thauera aminoaromatica TaxID=164330 RepID=A0A5C7T164_THASP|nr:MAG: hypothetical protein E6Q80_04395 [Thauera aminoaromatica]